MDLPGRRIIRFLTLLILAIIVLLMLIQPAILGNLCSNFASAIGG